MTMYRYYAVIEREKMDATGAFIVSFPDLDNVFTDADTLTGAVQNAEDVLFTMLEEMENDGDIMPAPSKADVLKSKLPEGASLIYIEVDTESVGN